MKQSPSLVHLRLLLILQMKQSPSLVRIDMLIYILGKNAVNIYDSFKLSGEDIQYANVKQKFEDDSLIQVYCHQFLKCGDIFSEYLKFPTKKMRVKCVKPPERQIQKSMRKQDRGNSL